MIEVGPTAARLDQAIRLGQGRPSSAVFAERCDALFFLLFWIWGEL
jgi:hypothetical protein